MTIRLSILLLLLSCGAACAETIRVATFNVCNYNIIDRHVRGTFQPRYPKPDDEKVALRNALKEVRPDIVVLQELGGPEFLDELQRMLKAEGLDYPHAHCMRAEGSNHALGILSTRPWKRLVEKPDIRIRSLPGAPSSRRGLLGAEFETGGRRWTILALHLKSRRNDDADDPGSATLRLAEAKALRAEINSHFKEAKAPAFIVAGDFNDDPGSSTLSAFQKGGPACTRMTAFDCRAPDKSTWTYRHARDNHTNHFDHILASPALLRTFRPIRAAIHANRAHRNASDHRMPWVDLETVGAAVAEAPAATR